MTKALIDTNVIIDYASKRQPFFANADKIIDAIIDNKLSAYISASTVTDIFYILKRENSQEKTLDFIKGLLTIIDVFSVDKQIIINALYSGWTDFEDAVQAEVSFENNVDIIITRNIKDFNKLKSIRVLTPTEFLYELQIKN
ncbi:twitching motility protein PilT [Bacteroidia bacterium]|nr:twitching motility protein PilT [Bacteroidia bacterium]